MLEQLIEVTSLVALRQLWQVTLTVGLLLLIARWIGRRSAHWAYALLLVAALKCLCPPLWSVAIGPFCWWGGAETSPVANEPSERSTAETESISDALTTTSIANDETGPTTNLDGTLVSQVDEQPTVADESATLAMSPSLDEPMSESKAAATQSPAAAAVVAPPTNADAVTTATSSIPWLRIVQWGFVLVWTGGSLVLLLGIMLKRRRLAQLVSRGEDITSGPIFELVDGLRTDLGLHVKLKVVILDEPGVPGVFGVRSPTVVLPRVVLDRMSSSELRLVLAHELNHLRRQDTVCGTVQLLAIIIWWFHPLVWWMNSHLRRYREHCCDEEVVARLSCRPSEYARCLLNVLSLRQELKPVVGVSALSPFDVTAQRLKNLMRQERSFSRHRSWMCVAASAILAIILLPGAALPRETSIQAAARAIFAPAIEADTSPDLMADTPMYQSGIIEPESMPEEVVPVGPPELSYAFSLYESPSYRLTITADEPNGAATYEATFNWRIDDVQGETVTLSRLPTVITRQQAPRQGAYPFEMPSIPSVEWHGMHGPVGPVTQPQFTRPTFPRGVGTTPPGWPEGMEPFGPTQPQQGTMSPIVEPSRFTGSSFGPPQADRFSLNGGAVTLGDPCWLPYGLGDAIDWIMAPLPHELDGGQTERTLSWAIESSPPFPGMPSHPSVLEAREIATWQVVERRDDEWVLMRDITRWSPVNGGSEPLESSQYKLTGTSLITWDVANQPPARRGVHR